MIKKIPSWVKVLLAAFFGFIIVLASTRPNIATNLLPDNSGQSATRSKLISAAYSKLPLSFEANVGQTDASVKFLSHSSGVSLFLTPTEAVLALSKLEGKPSDVSHPHAPKAQQGARSTSVVRMQLKGANSQPQMTGLEPLQGKVNYFLGSDPKQWHTNIPTYAKVQYQQVYPGVDMVYYGSNQQLEYDFVVAPGANPNIIQLAFNGASKLEVNQQNLVLHTNVGSIQLHKPVVYQQIEGKRREIASHYVLKGKNQVGFSMAAYDHNSPLIVDPVLSYSTYLGGSNYHGGRGIAVDRAGNAYITGNSQSTDFPTTQNSFQAAYGGSGVDAFVTKINADGSALVYSTYLGGNKNDFGNGIAVDRAGKAYITGNTASTDFPTENPFQGTKSGNTIDIYSSAIDAFATKLNATGSALVYSTYLGGSDLEIGNGIAVDREGKAYITGSTNSTDFPTQNPFQGAKGSSINQDAFVTKLNAEGSTLAYSTYLGGSNYDEGRGIAVDRANNVYMTGNTSSTDFPTENPVQAAKGSVGNSDAFVTKLNATGSTLVYSTYLGGSRDDYGSRIAVDRAGNAYITGNTYSTDFPTLSPVQAANGGNSDAFVTKINIMGSTLVYSTYLGGNGSDFGDGIAVGRASNVYIAGGTGSTDFPTENPVQAANGGGNNDAFVTKVNATGSTLVYSTYLGGSGNDFSLGIALDRADNAYITGSTDSSNFPTLSPLQAANNGSTNAFITKLTP